MTMLAHLTVAAVPLLLPLLLAGAEGGYRVVCYYGSWAVYRPGDGKFDVEDIDPTLCTHLVYGFVGLGEGDTVRVLDSWNDLPDNYGKGAMARFVKLKERSPTTKVMVSIGGWNEGSTKYSDMASSESRRQRFADNALAFVQKYGFDGLDLDWEYPAQRGGKPSDKDNFPKLLEAVYNKFHAKGLLFTAAFGASLKTVGLSYNIPEVSKYLDFINVMTYDYHGSWDTTTGVSAPLYADPTDASDEAKTMNIDTCVRNLLKLGAPAHKLNLGMGTYGHSFTLQDPQHHGVNAPISGPGEAGPYTRQTGTIGYNEICEQKNKWTIVWNDAQQVPYGYSNNQWIGYDNVKSIKIKSEYLKEKQFGGAMVWSLETDDFRNVCGEGKNPLLHTINAVLNGGTLPTGAPTTAGSTAAAQTGGGGQTAAPTTAAPQPTEPLPPATELCDHAGYVRDKTDCQVFYECVASGGQYLVYKFKCADGTYFDTTSDQCNYAEQVAC
ncbi:chitinase-3-like protein 1 [Bacillus rossius redtenbacheri]|uniref:chitinase-3-like protein 1 n=1 Tax=Bacillus rossius redtenbacheri TaxID=93214 RepID=UPI002FDCB6CC